MTIKEFWETDELIAIHCDTLQKAKRLLRIFTKMGKTWAKDNLSYNKSGWNIWKQEMCYDNKGGFGRLCIYRLANAKIIKFDELSEFKPFSYKSNENIPNNVSSRAWRTYNLIKRNSMQGKWTDKKEIVANDKFNAQTNPLGYEMNDRAHDVCAGIWEDVDNLNASTEIEKIIISNGRAFKLASNIDEATTYIESFKNKAVRAFKRYYNLSKKLKNNGQGKLLGTRLDPIDDKSKAREFVEAFINEIN